VTNATTAASVASQADLQKCSQRLRQDEDAAGRQLVRPERPTSAQAPGNWLRRGSGVPFLRHDQTLAQTGHTMGMSPSTTCDASLAARANRIGTDPFYHVSLSVPYRCRYYQIQNTISEIEVAG
jgi:hypothetical protein